MRYFLKCWILPILLLLEHSKKLETESKSWRQNQKVGDRIKKLEFKTPILELRRNLRAGMFWQIFHVNLRAGMFGQIFHVHLQTYEWACFGKSFM